MTSKTDQIYEEGYQVRLITFFSFNNSGSWRQFTFPIKAAHTIFGIPQTINAANYMYFRAYQDLLSLNYPVLARESTKKDATTLLSGTCIAMQDLAPANSQVPPVISNVENIVTGSLTSTKLATSRYFL